MACSLSLLLLLLLCSLSAAEAHMKLFNLRASDLPTDLFGIADGYVKVFCASASLGVTAVRPNNANPWWDDEFSYFNAQEGDVLRLEVYDDDVFTDDLLGVCQRNIRRGTHEHTCFLEEGGTLHYTYTLV